MGSSGVGNVFWVMFQKPENLSGHIKLIFFIPFRDIRLQGESCFSRKFGKETVVMLAYFLAIVKGDLEQKQYLSFWCG